MIDNDIKCNAMDLNVLNISLLQQLVYISKEHCLTVFKETVVVLKCLYIQNEVCIGIAVLQIESPWRY